MDAGLRLGWGCENPFSAVWAEGFAVEAEVKAPERRIGFGVQGLGPTTPYSYSHQANTSRNRIVTRLKTQIVTRLKTQNTDTRTHGVGKTDVSRKTSR